jgi:hypothetical protein
LAPDERVGFMAAVFERLLYHSEEIGDGSIDRKIDWRLARLGRYWPRDSSCNSGSLIAAPHPNAIGFQEGPSLPAAGLLFERWLDMEEI